MVQFGAEIKANKETFADMYDDVSNMDISVGCCYITAIA